MGREVATKKREDEVSRQSSVHDATSKVDDGASNKTAADEASRRPSVHDATGKVDDEIPDGGGPELAAKAKVLRIISRLNLPRVPPLDEIVHKLGHEVVAEMTGRRYRLRKQLNGLYRMEFRGKSFGESVKGQNLRAQQVCPLFRRCMFSCTCACRFVCMCTSA